MAGRAATFTTSAPFAKSVVCQAVGLEIVDDDGDKTGSERTGSLSVCAPEPCSRAL